MAKHSCSCPKCNSPLCAIFCAKPLELQKDNKLDKRRVIGLQNRRYCFKCDKVYMIRYIVE